MWIPTILFVDTYVPVQSRQPPAATMPGGPRDVVLWVHARTQKQEESREKKTKGATTKRLPPTKKKKEAVSEWEL